MPCESLVRTHCRRYVRTRAPKVVVPDARVASTPRPGLGAASRHTEPALDWSTPDREATQQCGCVVALGTRARTQNGHIRNDTRDHSRRIVGASFSPICRRNRVADDRTCTRDGKEGVDGSSPSEGFEVSPAQPLLPLSGLASVAGFGVHAASTSVHRGRCPALSSSSRRMACSRPSRARWP